MIEKNKIKVAFFGTSNRSVPILESLNKNHKLQLCITKSDTKVGRKQLLVPTQVKTWCIENNIPFITIRSTKDSDKDLIIKELKKYNIDIGIVADFSFMIPEAIISTPSFGLINIHFSLLPKYRGACPVQFSIINGDVTTGVTYYQMDKGMDTGKILHQFHYDLNGTETSGELYSSLFYRSSEVLPKVLDGYINGSIVPREQLEEHVSYTFSKTKPTKTFIFKEDAKLDLSKSQVEIYRSIRAYNPWPIAWTTLKELEECKYFKIEIKENLDKTLKVKIFQAQLIMDQLTIQKLQVEGKTIIGWEDLVNGYCKKVL